MEDEPIDERDEVIIDIAGYGDFLMTRHNTRLFTFIGFLATRDHVFMALQQPEEGIVRGAWVFQHDESYIPILSFIERHSFPMSLNNVEIEDYDENAFQRSLANTAGSATEDFIPDDWLGDGTN